MKRENFQRWFNRAFWKAFKNRTFPIKIPEMENEKNDLIEKVYLSKFRSKKRLRLNVRSPNMGVIHLTRRHGHEPSANSTLFCSLSSIKGITLTFCNLTSRTFTIPCASIRSNVGFVKKPIVRRAGSLRSYFIC